MPGVESGWDKVNCTTTERLTLLHITGLNELIIHVFNKANIHRKTSSIHLFI